MEPDQVSEVMKAKIDEEIKGIIEEGQKRAVNVLKKNRKKMDKLVKVLLEQETVEMEEFEKIMGVPKAGGEKHEVKLVKNGKK